jgi:hypothetical protein
VKDMHFKIEAVVETVTKYRGHAGALFDTEQDAKNSLAVPLLEDILEAGGASCDFSTPRAAAALIGRRKEVIALLQRLGPPQETAAAGERMYLRQNTIAALARLRDNNGLYAVTLPKPTETLHFMGVPIYEVD